MRTASWCRWALIGFVSGAIQYGNLFGQVPVAAIKGKVTDPSGATVVGGILRVHDRHTGARRTVETTLDGSYQVENLDPGEYEMEVASIGFGMELYDLSLRAGDNLTVNFQLKVKQSTESITVNGEIFGTNTSDFSLEGNVDRFQMESLPLNGRNYLELARLEPGVSVVSVANPGALGNNYQRVSVAGAQYLETRVSIDGSTVDDRINGGTALNLSQEAVSEFQIATFNFGLAKGATGTGAINIITRRGGKAVHGTSFFYYRDHRLAAYPGLRRDPSNPHPFFARRQTGFSLGGPLIKDRFFWFTNLEHNNQDGVFAVANNHPVFSKLDVVQPSPLNFDLYNLRLDGNFNNTHTGFVRVSLDRNGSIAPPGANVFMPSNWFTARTRAGQIQAALSSLVTPKFISDVRFSHAFLNNDLNAVTTAECPAPAACVGIGGPDILVRDAPLFRIGSHITVPKIMRTRTEQVVSNMTWQKGAHRVQFGGEWEHLDLNSFHAIYESPQITLWGPTDLQGSPGLRALFDALPVTLRDPNAGPPTLSDILQLPLRSLLIGIGDPMQPGPYHHDQASRPDLLRFYLQDQWNPRPRLTLTYGLGYLWRGSIFNQDLRRPEYLAELLGGNLRPPHHGTRSFEPSAGFAWSLRSDSATVIRAGAGLYHDELNFFIPFLERGVLGPAGNGRITVDGSVAGLSFLSLPTGVRGVDLLPQLPAIRSMLNRKLGDGTNAAITGVEVVKQGDRIFSPNHTTPSAIHFNAGIQQRLSPSLIVSADYVFRRFVHHGGFHMVGQVDRNRFNRPRVTGVNATTGEVSFVRDPVIPLCTTAQAATLDPRDYCSTGPINVYGSGANYLYRGLHVRLEGRLSSRLQLSLSYALGSNTGFVELTEYDNPGSAYGNAADQRRNRLNISGIYRLPGYQGRYRPLRVLLENWSVAFISQIDSAPPLNTMLAALDLDGDGISRTLLPGVMRHNALGRGLNESGLRKLVEQYNADVEARTSRMTNPSTSTVTVVRPRTPFNQMINPITLPERLTNGDSFITQDLRLTRRLNIGDTLTLSIFGEVFNVFNIANLSGYSNVLNMLNYGQPSSRAGQVFGSGGPRAFQFAARLQF